ncbi:DUF1918 domain-containing protein (plasmid) [Streptomyces sp. BHT-5-2]|uniref:DUF1918 domain-containing protein n=1 Tax=unclassified Streptomyces TaxID=2593676 RepID=UPI001C8EC65C|nr:DUF1918 domain-containing protein [Streptomyces sp. BHT-5-2]QZL07655.1 DUF1918 domain-containing protein [Streptomyces sp. BHT-5-2]
MQAHKGDVLRITGRAVGSPEHRATVVEVLGRNGEPPYRVRYEDGHESEIFPGPGCVTESVAGARPARTDAPRHRV